MADLRPETTAWWLPGSAWRKQMSDKHQAAKCVPVSTNREIGLLARFVDLKVHRDDMPEPIREIVERELATDDR